MAEETQKTADPAAPAPATSEVVSDVPVAEKASEPVVDPAAAVEEAPTSADEAQKIIESASFKEETNVVGELPDPQKRALGELKQVVLEALSKHELSAPRPPPPPQPVKEEEEPAPAKEEEKPAPAKEEEKPGPAKEEEKPAPAKEEEKPVPAKEEEKPVPAKEEEKPASAKEEKKPAPAANVPEEKPKTEEPKTEETAPAAKGDAPPPPPAEQKVPPAAITEPETVVAEAVVKEKSASVDDDGEKTVEAIKETIVAVSATAEPDAPPAAAEEQKESEVIAAEADAPPTAPEEVSIWEIPLLSGEKSDVVLLKFLRARDFKVKEAFTMLRNTVRWRKEFKIDTLLEEDLGTELDKVVYIHGVDKEGHPVCYNAYGEFQNKELYQSTFADEEKREKFLRWRIQFLEKTIRKELDFSPDGICTFVQVNDLKASPGIFRREHRLATNRALQLLQDNYPEFVAKQVFINVPWWYLAFYRMISPFFTQRTKSKFVFAGPSKSTETLFKYIAPEQVPVQYGGLSREGEQEFSAADTATEEMIKPATKHTVEFPVSEPSTLVWEARVIGWDVSYGAEFVPDAEGGYTVIVQKSRKIAPADETVISGSFKVSDAGKVVLTFDNSVSSKKRKLLYRSKTKPSE